MRKTIIYMRNHHSKNLETYVKDILFRVYIDMITGDIRDDFIGTKAEKFFLECHFLEVLQYHL